MTYKPTPTRTRAGQKEVVSSDLITQQMLERILIVLEKINVNLSLGSDNTVDDGDKL